MSAQPPHNWHRVSWSTTDIGRRRTTNEDAYVADDRLGLYAVADGMGGHNAGEVASQEAIDALVDMVSHKAALLQDLAREPVSAETLRAALRLMESAVQAATYMVFGIAQTQPESEGMGTTVSSLLLAGKYAITAQVGDSRIYMIRKGHAFQLTEDHTLVAWQIKQGVITAAEAERSPHKNVITRAVGSRDYVQVDTRAFVVQPDDCFLVCSDGLHGYLRDDELATFVSTGPSTAPQRLVDTANQRGGKDNITVVVAEVSAR